MPALPGADPFFEVSPDEGEAERLSSALERRSIARAFLSSAAYRSTSAIVRVYTLLFQAALVGAPLAITVQSLLRAGGLLRVDFWIGLALCAGAAALLAGKWARKNRIARAIASLGKAMGGSWGGDRHLSVLDWLDEHWRAETPIEVTDAPGLFEQRWDVQATHEGSAVLVLAQQRPVRVRAMPPVRRVSIFLSAPNWGSAAGGYDPTPAMRELERMGFGVKRTGAGVYMSQPGISAEMLERGFVYRALEVAQSLAFGRPLPHRK
jgi:hypothetical protein